MIIVNNVMRQSKKSPVKNAQGKVIAYFKKERLNPFCIYLENILDEELMLSIREEEKVITSLVLLPREIINLVFNNLEVNTFKKMTIEPSK